MQDEVKLKYLKIFAENKIGRLENSKAKTAHSKHQVKRQLKYFRNIMGQNNINDLEDDLINKLKLRYKDFNTFNKRFSIEDYKQIQKFIDI